MLERRTGVLPGVVALGLTLGCTSVDTVGDVIDGTSGAETRAEHDAETDTDSPSPPLLPPGPTVHSLVGVGGDGEVTLIWTVSSNEPVAGFAIVHSLVQPGPPWPAQSLVAGVTEWTIGELENGTPIHAAIHIVLPSGELGPQSEVVEVTPRQMIGSRIHVSAGFATIGWEPGLHGPDETPAHEVWLDAYAIDRYPVTVAQYGACVAADACAPLVSPGGFVHPSGWVEDLTAVPAALDHPVVFLRWGDASDVCAFRGLRLPTEAEWERAARGPGPDLYAYPWGSENPTCEVATFLESDGSCTRGTLSVGSQPAGRSPVGAFGMAGGVWEWTADWYAEDAYATPDRQNPAGPPDGTRHVVRSGAWNSPPAELFTTARRAGPREFELVGDPNVDYAPYGVRCAEALLIP